MSNINDPGLWMYKISQGATPNPATIESVGKFDINKVLDNLECKEPLLTLEGQAWAHTDSLTDFKIKHCVLPLHSSLDAQILGQQETEILETRPVYDEVNSELSMKIEWSSREPVIVIILLDGVPLNISDLGKMVFFYDVNEDGEILDFYNENGIIAVTDTEGNDVIGAEQCLTSYRKY